jgi:hypothetical protein
LTFLEVTRTRKMGKCLRRLGCLAHFMASGHSTLRLRFRPPLDGVYSGPTPFFHEKTGIIDE